MKSPFLGGSGQRVRAGLRWLLRRALLAGPCLLLVEVALQLLAPSYKDQIYDHDHTGGHLIEMNADGCRGPALRVEKRPGEYRVLALGDSTTFGTGVATSDTWPEGLIKRLSAARGGRCSVLNAGVPACRISEAQAVFAQRWQAYKPDLVVLAVSNNMPSLGWIRRKELASPPYNGFAVAHPALGTVQQLKLDGRRALHRLCLPSFLSRNSQRLLYWMGLATHNVEPSAPYGPMLAHGWRQARLDPDTAEDAWDLLERDLSSLASAVQAEGSSLVVTHIPARFMLTRSEFDNEKRVPRERLSLDPTARLAAVCERLNLAYADAAGALRRAREISGDPLYIPFDFTHLNAAGHDAVAAALASSIE